MSAPQIVITLDPGASGRYTLTASTEPNHASGQYDFTLRATEIATGRTSVVNQMNFILSWFDAAEFEDWPWTARWSRLCRWLRDVLKLGHPGLNLEDTRSNFAELEAALDEDRAEGEWSNTLQANPPTGDDLCGIIQRNIAQVLSDVHTTWLTAGEMLAQVEPGAPLRVPVQLGVEAVYVTQLHPNGDVTVVAEVEGVRVLPRAEFLAQYPDDLGKVWRFVDPLTWTKPDAPQPEPRTNCPRCGDELFCNTCGGKV